MTTEELKQQATVIRDETQEEANTALRVGRVLVGTVEKVEECFAHLNRLPNAIQVVTESQLEYMAQHGTLQDGVLYLGLEEED